MENTKSASQLKAEDSAALLRARNPLLWIVTREEQRAKRYVFEAAGSALMVPRAWSVSKGVTSIDGRPDRSFDGLADPDAILSAIDERKGGTKDNPNRGVWILCDFPAWVSPPAGIVTLRRLRELAMELPGRDTYNAQAIVIISPTAEVPPELADHATVIEWPMPDRSEIAAALDATIATLPQEMRETAVNGSRDAAIDAAVGLSYEEAQATFAKSLVQLRRVDPAVIATEKKRIVAKSGLAEWIDPIPGGIDAVGGLPDWKAWVTSRATAYTPAARAYGLPAPKGALLVGVPGCGKSLSAKAVPTEWKVPCIRLDLGALKSKFVGESEANLRNTLAMIDALGRCVVWIDEVEKALAGSTGEQGDGGVSADALGTILSWMNDRTSQAFVIATANDASKLPPELLRKGRFDEVFWVDLPDYEERKSIVLAALRAHGRDNANGRINPSAIAGATEQFTGAEIAALVPDALFTAFNDGGREITTDDLLSAAKMVVPLAKTADAKIRALREFWSGRARPATSATAVESTEAQNTLRALDF